MTENPFLGHSKFRSRFEIPQMDGSETPVDLSSNLRNALASPVLFPPLSEAIFSGDKVALAVQPHVPHVRSVVEEVVRQLLDMQVSPSDISVVITEDNVLSFNLDPTQYRLPPETRGDHRSPLVTVRLHDAEVKFEVHDSDNQAALAYLAANEAGHPVYLNRTMVDADFVLTVGSPLPGDAERVTDCLYPIFGSREARERFDSLEMSDWALQKEIELANDMLGAFFVTLLVCGPGDVPTEFVAGVRKQATDQARQATNQCWKFPYQQQAETIVATIESQDHGQTWDSFADAVSFANRFMKGDGPIVIWSELKQSPNKYARRACNEQFENHDSTQKLPERFRRLASVVSERPVYLRSQLSRNATESLGLGYLETIDEVIRVTSRFDRGLFIRDAHRCQS